jgi:hypothetical protein
VDHAFRVMLDANDASSMLGTPATPCMLAHTLIDGFVNATTLAGLDALTFAVPAGATQAASFSMLGAANTFVRVA